MADVMLEVSRAGVRLATLAALAVALPAQAASPGLSPGSAWIATLLVALAAVAFAVVRLRSTLPPERAVAVSDDPEPARAARAPLGAVPDATARRRRDPSVSAAARGDARVEPGSTPAPGASRASASVEGGDRVLRLLRARMDDVTYEPGTPNVLSMTKRLGAPAEVASGAPARAAEEDAGARCLRSDDGDETVLAIDGVLDATTTSAVAATLDALVAERRPSVTLDLSSLRAVDGAGVASLVRLRSRCRAFGGSVRVIGLTRQPRALFHLLHADDPSSAD